VHYNPWGPKESDTTEILSTAQHSITEYNTDYDNVKKKKSSENSNMKQIKSLGTRLQVSRMQVTMARCEHQDIDKKHYNTSLPSQGPLS